MKIAENSQNFDFEGVMTIFWKFVETFRQFSSLGLFEEVSVSKF